MLGEYSNVIRINDLFSVLVNASGAGGQVRTSLLFHHNVPVTDVFQIIRVTDIRPSTGCYSHEGLLHGLLSDWHGPVFQELNKKIEEEVLETLISKCYLK